MHFLWISCLLFLSGCVPPVYEQTTYGIDEFIADSAQINMGKQAILGLENQDLSECIDGAFACYEDQLTDGDILSISLYCPRRPDRVESLNMINQRTGFPVMDGKILIPHLQPIEVEGLTLKNVKELIKTAYCNDIPNAEVFVNFKKRKERRVQIIGAGVPFVVVDGSMRLYEVMGKANIPPYANLFKSYVERDGQQLPIDLYKLLHEGDECQNIVMHGGDKIFIARAQDATIMVTGEIRPMVIPVPYGFMSLREAIVLAGGIPFTGDKCHIYIIRGNMKRPKVYELSWRDITHVPNQALLLMTGDVVFISETAMSQWNRFIDQIEPSITCIQTGNNNYILITND